MKLYLLLFVIFLAACGTSVVTVPPMDRPLSVQEAGRIVIDATNTAQVMATQNTVATAQRKATEQAGGDRMTATAFAVGIESTKTREQWTAQAAYAVSTSQNANATATATAQIGKDALENKRIASELEGARQSGETLRATIYMIALVVAVALITLTVVGALYWLAYLNRRDAEARVRATRDTNAGTVTADELGRLVVITPTGVMIIGGGNIIARAASPLPSLPAPGDGDDEEKSGLTGEERDRIDDSLFGEQNENIVIDQITVNQGEQSHTIMPLTKREIEDQSRMIYFLRKAMSAHNHNKVDGRKSNRVPGWRDIGLESASTWTDYTEMFGDRLVKVRGMGGGTFVAEPYKNLGELLEAVQMRRVASSKNWKGRKSKANSGGTIRRTAMAPAEQ